MKCINNTHWCTYVSPPSPYMKRWLRQQSAIYYVHNYENTVISGIFYCHLKIKQKEIYGKTVSKTYTLLSIRKILRSSIPKNRQFRTRKQQSFHFQKSHRHFVTENLQKPSLYWTVHQRTITKRKFEIKICLIYIFFLPKIGNTVFDLGKNFFFLFLFIFSNKKFEVCLAPCRMLKKRF